MHTCSNAKQCHVTMARHQGILLRIHTILNTFPAFYQTSQLYSTSTPTNTPSELIAAGDAKGSYASMLKSQFPNILGLFFLYTRSLLPLC